MEIIVIKSVFHAISVGFSATGSTIALELPPSFTSGNMAMENQNLKEVNTWMTEDVVSWLKDTGQETIQNIIIGTIIMMHRLPFTVSLNTTWGKKGVP